VSFDQLDAVVFSPDERYVFCQTKPLVGDRLRVKWYFVG